MLFADDRVFKKLEETHKKLSNNEPLQRYTVQLMTIHFILNPQARKNISSFLYANIGAVTVTIIERRERWNGLVYLGNFSFRSLRQWLRAVRLSDSHGVRTNNGVFNWRVD